MSAVAEETRGEHELSWRDVDALLKYWGSSRWRVGLCGGFPEASSITTRVELYEPREWFQVKQITASGRQNPYYGGHRILYDQAWTVSPRLILINTAVNALPEPQFRAVAVSYAVGYMSGEKVSQKQQADMLGISAEALSERLRRARKRLATVLGQALFDLRRGQ